MFANAAATENVSTVKNYKKKMQSDRNSFKMDFFHEPTTYEPQAKKSSNQILTFAGHKYGSAFKIKMRLLVQ